MTERLLLVHPDPPPAELARALEGAAYSWKAANGAEELLRAEPGAGGRYAAAVVAADCNSGRVPSNSGRPPSAIPAWARGAAEPVELELMLLRLSRWRRGSRLMPSPVSPSCTT